MSLNFKSIRTTLVLACMLIAGAVQAQTVKVNVKDSSGEAVIGASILEKGTRNGGVTDFDGNFTIKMTGKNVIVVSYIGMKTQEVNVAGKQSVDVVLQDDATTLQDVVVVGYGTMKKNDLTGSVASVNTEQLNAKGAPSVLGNLQGSNPGVNITQTSGRAGDSYNIEIRGKSSINSKTTPLYVVDGVMCDDINFLNPQDIERIDVLKDASSTAIYGSRATAGVIMVTTKGGLSVKKDQKPTISYDGYYGWSQTARMPDFQTGEDFYNYRFLKFLVYAGNNATAANALSSHPVYQIGGTVLGQCLLREFADSGDYLMKKMLANGDTYDWPGLVTQNGSQQNHFVSVNGGSESVNYHFGVGYNGEEGIYKGDESNRVNFKGSVDARINKVISAGFNMNIARSEREYANDDMIKFAYRSNPYFIPYDENGDPWQIPGGMEALGTSTGSQYQFSSQQNPLLVMQNTYKQREAWRLLGNIYLKLDLMKGLDFKTTFSPNYNHARTGYFEGYINPKSGTFYDTDVKNNTANQTVQRGFTWTWDNIINYNTRINDHSIGVMGLFSQQAGNTETVYVAGDRVMENTDWWNMGTAQDADGNVGLNSNSYTRYTESSMTSYALRANYGYKDRYLLTATVRWDGSSKFAKDNRWGCFPSVAAAWRISEEEFMKKADWLSNLKLRLSYGVTGNCDGIGNYDTQQTLSDPISYPFGTAYSTGYTASKIVNKDLKWETSTEYNFGLDFGFLGGRINGSIDLYQKTSKDLLYEVFLPLESGGGSMITNIGSVRNQGVEISLSTVNVQTKDWRWETTFTFATNKNKVREINGTGDRVLSSGITTGSLFIGSSVNNIYAYEIGGIVSDRDMTVPDNEIARTVGLTPGTTMKEYDYYYQAYGLTEGQPWIVDKDGNGSFDENDRTITSTDPKWTGSFTSNLSWKNWDFSFSLYAKVGYKAYSNFLSEYWNLGDRGRMRLNGDWYIPAGTLIDCDGVNEDGTYINPVYQTATHYGDMPFPNNGGSNGGVGKQADYWNIAKCVQNASFMKVKNITLGYTFDKSLLSKFGCKHLRLYCTVTNPFVITKYKGFDPEWADAALKNDGPSTINYQVGASIKF